MTRKQVKVLLLAGCFVGILGLAALACAFGWNFLNRGALQRDLSELLGQQARLSLFNCEMIGSTRSGFCLSQGEAGDIEQLASAFHLMEVNTSSSPDIQLRYKHWEAEGGCRNVQALSNLNRVRIFVSERRPAELRLDSGSAFEYLMVYFNPANRVMCIQVSYAYS